VPLAVTADVLCAGNVTVPATANTNYTFSMDSDDGAQLYINGQLLIDKGGALWFACKYPVHCAVSDHL